MNVTVTYVFPGVKPDSEEATEILDMLFDRADLMRLAEEAGAQAVILDDVTPDFESTKE